MSPILIFNFNTMLNFHLNLIALFLKIPNLFNQSSILLGQLQVLVLGLFQIWV